MYKYIIRPLLFLFSAETAHSFTFNILKLFFSNSISQSIVRSFYNVKHPLLEQNLMGIHFPNPVGLAAGFDKDAEVFKIMSAFGFGFIEVGTVTPVAQEGNPLPRMFRLLKDKSIINRMGFNNKGVNAATEKLKRKKNIIIGGNIGKNKITVNENAVSDYIQCFEKLFDVVNYFVVNVSSPNTPGLRELQNKKSLLQLLQKLQSINNSQSNPKPILLKIAPDLSNEQLDDIIDVCQQSNLSGIIATNTTISRDNLESTILEIESIGAGGLSGAALTNRATEVIRHIRKNVDDEFIIIGVGGIMNAEDAIDKIKAGANLIQIYSGFIYEGPAIVNQINKALIKFYN